MKDHSDVHTGLPNAFLARMSEMLGVEYQSFLASMQHPSLTGLRVNLLKIAADEFLQISPFNLSSISWCSSGYIVDTGDETSHPLSAGKHPYHRAGLYYLQEPSAMAAAEILSPQPGETVLDLAAAPGGKATHLAALMNNKGLLVANEIHPKRVWDLTENLERCGVTNTVVVNENPRNMTDHFGEYFDRVLLDAPCSGEGMFRKSESARNEWSPGLVHSCALRQSSILELAAQMLKPGGHLAYTTCTFSPEENEGVLLGFLEQHPEFEMKQIPPVAGFLPGRPDWVGLDEHHQINHAVRIWPHLSRSDGHFIALLVKHGSSHQKPLVRSQAPRRSSNRSLSSKDALPAFSILDNFLRKNSLVKFDPARLFLDGTYVYLSPQKPLDLNGLKVIRPGWWLGSIRKGIFTPSHSLAMAMDEAQARQVLPLSVGDGELSSYLGGASFPSPGDDGWVLVTVDGFPVGWGKRVQGMLKNFYPHGLRQLV